MGELNIEKPLYCLICDSEVKLNQSYSIFYTFITNSGILLANSLEKNLSLKDIGSLSLRSNLVCLQCFGYFEQLTKCESQIIKLKGALWTVYRETCEKHGEKAETYVKGVSTQTDFRMLECDCKANKNSTYVNLELETFDSGKNNEDCDVVNGLKDDIINSNSKLEAEKPGVEITIDADPHFTDTDATKWKNKPESCKLCGKWFKKVSELNNHMIHHTDMEKGHGERDSIALRMKKKFHPCTICSKKFRRPCELKDHIISHKSAIIFICKHCGKRLKSKTGAIYHTLKTHKIDVGNSKKLGEHFHIDIKTKDTESENNEDYVKKINNFNKIEGNVKKNSASFIVESSSSEDELPLARRRKEFISEKTKKDYSKKLCGSEKTLETERKEACPVLKKCCNVSVTNTEDESKKNLSSLDTLKQVNDRNESEEMCSKKPDLTKMLESEEEDSISPILETKRKPKNTKNKKYPLTSILKIRRQKDTNTFPPPMKEPKFKCDVCGKMWKTRGELNAHKITHSDARPYICEICGQAYKHKPALDVHVGMHRGIYHHQCPYCQKAFTQKGALQRHLPIHTGDLPYQCELCGKRFVHHTSFSMHGLAHTGIRNVKCQICGMGLLSKSHLRRHTRVHTGEKPFSCTVCGKPFAERYNLVAHQRIHDPNLVGPARQQKKKPQTCRLCNATFDRRHKLEDHMVTVHNKVVEDTPRPTIFESGEGYSAPRLIVEASRKQADKETQEDKILLGNPNPNDLSVRSIPSLQSSHLRNMELLRNLESSRNFELIRMANGIGGIDENLRTTGSNSVSSWTYVNPGS